MKRPPNKASMRQPWNRNRAVGQKQAFTFKEVLAIETMLLSEQNWHDLAMLSFALDTMFRAGDLLNTKIEDITHTNGAIRHLIPRKQSKTKYLVCPVLTKPAKYYLAMWLKISGKQKGDYLFTRTKSINGSPITRVYYANLVKEWAVFLGHNGADYSTHSIRRTKPTHMYWHGIDIALIAKLLGHKSTAVTIEYLGITQQKAEQASLRYSLMKGKNSNK